MSQTVLNPSTTQQLLKRAKNLQANLQPQWGKMTVTEMLAHANMTNERILNWDGKLRKATFRQKVSKFVGLRVLTKFPKNIKGAPIFDTKGKIDESEFEKEKQRFMDLLSEFPNTEKKLKAPHPLFGPLTKKEWGVVAYKHLDHHLRQFGV